MKMKMLLISFSALISDDDMIGYDDVKLYLPCGNTRYYERKFQRLSSQASVGFRSPKHVFIAAMCPHAVALWKHSLSNLHGSTRHCEWALRDATTILIIISVREAK